MAYIQEWGYPGKERVNTGCYARPKWQCLQLHSHVFSWMLHSTKKKKANISRHQPAGVVYRLLTIMLL
jgi:hypothetical protein